MERVCFQLQVRPDRLDEYRERHEAVWPEMLKAIAESNKFSDDTAATLQSEVDKFKQEFASGDGGGIQVGSEESAAAEDEDIEQERIVRQKR